MTEIKYMNTNGLNECYQIHNLYRREFTIGDFEEFKTLEEAEAKGRERMQKDGGILSVRIRRFFRKDGHIYYDGSKQWELRRA